MPKKFKFLHFPLPDAEHVLGLNAKYTLCLAFCKPTANALRQDRNFFFFFKTKEKQYSNYTILLVKGKQNWGWSPSQMLLYPYL